MHPALETSFTPRKWTGTVEVGETVRFVYRNQKTGETSARHVRVESLEQGGLLMRGWDYTAARPTGGYRCFHMWGVEKGTLQTV